MKITFAALAFCLFLSQAPAFAGNQTKGIDVFDGATFQLVERVCSAGPTPANPTKVFDLTSYHQTWDFSRGSFTFQIHNPTAAPAKCATRIEGRYGLADLNSGGVDAILATSTESRRMIACAPTYAGPVLGSIHKIVWLGGYDRFLTFIRASEVRAGLCPGADDYLVTVWNRYLDLPL